MSSHVEDALEEQTILSISLTNPKMEDPIPLIEMPFPPEGNTTAILAPIAMRNPVILMVLAKIFEQLADATSQLLTEEGDNQ